MLLKNKILVILFLVLFCILGMYSIVLAGDQTQDQPSSSGTVKLDNPLGETKTPQVLIGKVINAVLGIVGSLALAMFIYGGFTWMLAGGNSEAVTKGKNILIWATLGLVVIFTSYALVHFVIFDALVGSK